ncbi:hypothetical protein D3OALGA1CA_2311 [Olavius algarvensis associated proteobacterium Delta 3]|nr:hypothetical protein D3OALGB2SA_213 [Olavius algarvensis associated proteobacterium Delta 3]CAB5116735.1 hypothetical protein D3OALGA1CA_2311 [Olavius algarvensis associated proteobacterium Delta 3]
MQRKDGYKIQDAGCKDVGFHVSGVRNEWFLKPDTRHLTPDT